MRPRKRERESERERNGPGRGREGGMGGERERRWKGALESKGMCEKVEGEGKYLALVTLAPCLHAFFKLARILKSQRHSDFTLSS